MLKVIAVLLGIIVVSITSGFACLGASYFFENLNKYEQEAKYFIDEK
jgi:hypothetical protein